mmetsp:Transcript_8648/g.24868  ORF Transcript_8648/g.24868 Transcript_8648/m.24868 type:complete len:234 (+) Transcript_8648:225-926(+)
MPPCLWRGSLKKSAVFHPVYLAPDTKQCQAAKERGTWELRERRIVSTDVVIGQAHFCDITYEPQQPSGDNGSFTANLSKSEGNSIVVKGLQTVGPGWLITTFYNGIRKVGHMVALSASYNSANGCTGATVSVSRDATGEVEVETELVHRPPLPLLQGCRITHLGKVLVRKEATSAKDARFAVGMSVVSPSGIRFGCRVEPLGAAVRWQETLVRLHGRASKEVCVRVCVQEGPC